MDASHILIVVISAYILSFGTQSVMFYMNNDVQVHVLITGLILVLLGLGGLFHPHFHTKQYL